MVAAHLHEAGLGPAEDDARHDPAAVLPVHPATHEVGVVGGRDALGARHGDAVLLGEHRGVDVVDVLGQVATQDPGQQAGRDRPGEPLDDVALHLDLNPPDGGRRHVELQHAQLLRQRHIGHGLCEIGARIERQVDRVPDVHPPQGVEHLLGDLGRDVPLGFGGRGTEVRGVNDVRQADERVRRVRRLGAIDVDAGGAYLSRAERVRKRFLVDEGAPGRIDDHHAVFHGRDRLG